MLVRWLRPSLSGPGAFACFNLHINTVKAPVFCGLGLYNRGYGSAHAKIHPRIFAVFATQSPLKFCFEVSCLRLVAGLCRCLGNIDFYRGAARESSEYDAGIQCLPRASYCRTGRRTQPGRIGGSRVFGQARTSCAPASSRSRQPIAPTRRALG